MPAVLDPARPDEPSGGEVLSDEALAALALAADPDQPIDTDAVPWVGADGDKAELLPSWYMPAPTTGARSPWQRAMGLTFVGALLVINVSGLCVTYGVIELA